MKKMKSIRGGKERVGEGRKKQILPVFIIWHLIIRLKYD